MVECIKLVSNGGGKVLSSDRGGSWDEIQREWLAHNDIASSWLETSFFPIAFLSITKREMI